MLANIPALFLNCRLCCCQPPMPICILAHVTFFSTFTCLLVFYLMGHLLSDHSDVSTLFWIFSLTLLYLSIQNLFPGIRVEMSEWQGTQTHRARDSQLSSLGGSDYKRVTTPAIAVHCYSCIYHFTPWIRM